MKPGQFHYWVFDMDGTLTLPCHDYALIRRTLDIPDSADILHHLAALPAAEARHKHQWLLDYERSLALAARPAPGARRLVQHLRTRGCQLGLLTRNARELALITLQVLGLDDCFADGLAILGRDEAPPKPDPGGLLQLARHWQTEPDQLVMVGDYRNDLECARRAGACSILVNRPASDWPELTDVYQPDCQALLRQLESE